MPQEYGSGRLSKKHSKFFADMMRELQLDPTPEAYFDYVTWQVSGRGQTRGEGEGSSAS